MDGYGDRSRPLNIRKDGEMPPGLQAVIEKAEARSSDPEKQDAAVARAVRIYGLGVRIRQAEERAREADERAKAHRAEMHRKNAAKAEAAGIGGWGRS